MFRLDNLLERWAGVYAPLANACGCGTSQNFFRIDRIGGDNAFARNFNTAPSPAMAVPTNIDAEMGDNPKQVVYHHGIYIMVKQASAAANMPTTNHADEREASDCKEDLDTIAQDLLAYLFHLRTRARGDADIPGLTPEDRIAIKGFELEKAKWWTVPEMYNGWWVLGLEFDHVESRMLCIKEEKYTERTMLT